MLPSSISAASQQPPSSLSATSQQLPNSIPQSTTNDTTHLAQACMCKCICECMCDCTCERIGVNIGGQPCVWRWYAGLASVCLQAPCSIHRSLQEIQIAATRSVQAEEGQSTYRHHVCNAAAVLPLAELPSFEITDGCGYQSTPPSHNDAAAGNCVSMAVARCVGRAMHQPCREHCSFVPSGRADCTISPPQGHAQKVCFEDATTCNHIHIRARP